MYYSKDIKADDSGKSSHLMTRLGLQPQVLEFPLNILQNLQNYIPHSREFG
jgi:hypothetical protein